MTFADSTTAQSTPTLTPPSTVQMVRIYIRVISSVMSDGTGPRAVRPAFTQRWPPNLDLRLSATSLSRWTVNPLFCTRSTDLTELAGTTVDEHQKGPRPVSCEINSRLRRFGYRTVHPTGPSDYYKQFTRSVFSARLHPVSRPHDRGNSGQGPALRLELLTSPWTLER